MGFMNFRYFVCGVLVIVYSAVFTNEERINLDRYPAVELTEYRAYRDVTIFHFALPDLVREAVWTFNASERLSSASVVTSCPQRSVTVYLKQGSYPVVNPDNSSFPKLFYNDRVSLYHLDFDSKSVLNRVNVSSPEPGDWFVIAFLSYTDPNDDQILQQGIAPVCSARLQVSLEVIRQDKVVILSPGINVDETLVIEDSNEERFYRIFVPRLAWLATVDITIITCETNTGDTKLENCPSFLLMASVNALSNVSSNTSVQEECSDFHQNNKCRLYIIPSENTWLYISFLTNNSELATNNTIKVNYLISVDFALTNVSVTHSSELSNLLTTDDLTSLSFINTWATCHRVPLMRQSYSSFFSFGYVMPNAKSGDIMNISVDYVSVLEFEVRGISDIGGTLGLDIILMDIDSHLKNITESFNVSIVACVNYGTRSIPLYPNLCLDIFNRTSPAQMVVNSTSKTNSLGVVYIPYPESGMWYVSYLPFCFRTVFDSFGNKTIEESSCGNLTSVNVSFSVESFACRNNNCGQYGRCYTYMNGGMLYSTCVCSHGYTGWWCTDDSKVSSFSELLLAALLLTLSNLLFIPSVIFAIRRKYYTEAVVYSSTMFFSTFYHACDAGEDVYSYCMLPLKTLQFCDFYTAILALWVTMIAMARLNRIWRSIAHMIGAIVIALGTEYDRTSLWVFLVPCAVGLVILLALWIYRCRSKRSCYPTKSYYKLFFIPGTILVIVGLVCFAFLQTRSNYKFVHSAWHMIMALAIVFLLPAYRHIQVENTESDKSSDSSLWLRGKTYFCLKWCRRI